jgi:hypothetical protein
MAHYCRICGNHKPNEKFSGKGHRTHVCKQCSKLPAIERDQVDHFNEIYQYWEQKHISPKNIIRLKKLTESKDPVIFELATVVLEVAEQYPAKRKRIARIAEENIKLISRLEKVHLIQDWVYGDYGESLEYDEEAEYNEYIESKHIKLLQQG